MPDDRLRFLHRLFAALAQKDTVAGLLRELHQRLSSLVPYVSMQVYLPAEGGFETVAGFLLFRFGDIPQAGNAVEYQGRRFTVKEMDRNRIARVRIEKLPQPAVPEQA